MASSPTKRLPGIELMRGLAAFGVICIHSGIAVHNQTTPAAGILRDSFAFAVPFFLVTAFFFAIRGEGERRLSWSDWMRRQAANLFVPFVFWSLVYLALHIGKFLVHHETDKIKPLFTVDPAALILSGGTSVALYFLPLVFTGFVLIRLLSNVFKKAPAGILLVGLLVTLALQIYCQRAGYTFKINNGDTGEFWIPLGLGLMENLIRCAPLVFAAGLLARYLPPSNKRNSYAFIIAGVLLMVMMAIALIPANLVELIDGLGAFLVAWGLSGTFASNQSIVTIGLFSFGIYLVHQVFLESIQVLVPARAPVGIAGTLAITAAVYIMSMLTVGLASRGNTPVRKIFGLR